MSYLIYFSLQQLVAVQIENLAVSSDGGRTFCRKILCRKTFCRQTFCRTDILPFKISLFSASCRFGKMSFRRKVRSSNCPFDKMFVRQSVRRQNVRSAKCLSAKCLSAKCLSAKCPGTAFRQYAAMHVVQCSLAIYRGLVFFSMFSTWPASIRKIPTRESFSPDKMSRDGCGTEPDFVVTAHLKN